MTATPTAAAETVPGVAAFVDEVVADYGRRCVLLPDGGDRRALEDAIALLRRSRRRPLDAAAFERMLDALCAGVAPDGHSLLKPRDAGADLLARWAAWRGQAGTSPGY
jgi:hypothetical protein